MKHLLFIILCGIHPMVLAVEPPKQVAINVETAFQIDLGQGKASIKLPAGTVVDVVETSSDSIVLKRGSAIANVPISSTDFAQRYQALIDRKKAEEVAAKKAEEAEEAAAKDRIANEEFERKRKVEAFAERQKRAGDKPAVIQNPITGSISIPSAMVREIKSRLKDPDSFQTRGVNKLQIVEKNGVACWEVGITYAAKNGFGGYNLGSASGFMSGSTLLLLEMTTK